MVLNQELLYYMAINSNLKSYYIKSKSLVKHKITPQYFDI